MKAFLCIHGFGKYQAGLSGALHREVEALLGAKEWIRALLEKENRMTEVVE